MAGQGYDGAMLSSGRVIGIHRIRQEYLVQNLHSPHIAGTHAEYHKGLILKLCRVDTDLSALITALVEHLALGEEAVLTGLHGLQRIDIHHGLFGPQSVIGLSGFLYREK